LKIENLNTITLFGYLLRLADFFGAAFFFTAAFLLVAVFLFGLADRVLDPGITSLGFILDIAFFSRSSLLFSAALAEFVFLISETFSKYLSIVVALALCFGFLGNVSIFNFAILIIVLNR